MVKGKAEIYAEACKSCLFCVNTCPKKVLGTTDLQCLALLGH